MNKVFFCSLLALSAFLLVSQATTVEARCHHRSSHVQVGVGLGAAVVAPGPYVARRYVRPMPQQVYVAAPGPYYNPVYIYQAPVYVEEVYVAPPCRQIGLGLGGLSFSWNFFR